MNLYGQEATMRLLRQDFAEFTDPVAEQGEARRRATDVVLSRSAQFDNAKLFAKDKLTLFAKGKSPTLGTYFYQKEWWQWNGAFYEKAPEQRLTDMVCNYNGQCKGQE